MEPGMSLITYTIMTGRCIFSYMGSKSGSHSEKASLLSYQCVLSPMGEVPGSS